MVNVMSLCQSYKQQKITEVKLFNRHHNSTDFMTKTEPSSALKMLIDLNCINISITKWVEQTSINQASINI